MIRWLPVVALGLAACALALRAAVGGSEARAATGPCNPSSPGIAPNEADLWSQVNGWRATNLGMPAMTLTGPANAAAQWFAEAMIAGTTQGHSDQYGRTWVDRLVDCGLTGRFGSGEALAGFGSSDAAFGSTPSQALALMVADPNHQNAVNAPVAWQCGGVGYATNPNPSPGKLRYAWVVVTVQVFSPCPADNPTPTPTSTSTPTLTPTPSPSPTATPTSTPEATPVPSAARRAAAPLVTRAGDEGPSGPAPSPTPSPAAACGGASAAIVRVDKGKESVLLSGQGDLTGWRIVSERGFAGGPGEEYRFPDGFVLSGFVTVRAGVTADGVGPGELWWGTPAGVWLNNEDDDAFLFDCTGALVSTFEDGEP